MTFKVIEHGLCGECQPEVYALTYGVDNITPKKYPKDWRTRQKAQDKAFEEMAEQRSTRVVVVADFFDDFAYGRDDGVREATLCERHLREALDALLQTNDQL